MKYFNKQDIEKLSQYENYFHSVINAKYKRATSTRVNDEIADIYELTTGEILQRNYSCAKCIFTIFEKAAKLYYKSLEVIAENSENSENSENDTKSEQNDTNETKLKADETKSKARNTKKSNKTTKSRATKSRAK